MLNKTKHLRKLCLLGCLIIGPLLLAAPANAQFIGIDIDYAIAYSAAPGSVTGGSVGIAHPAPFSQILDIQLSALKRKNP